VKSSPLAFAACAAAILAVPSCLLPSFSGFTGPRTADGGASPADGGASPGDGGFCAKLSPAPAFCADFDEGNPVDFGWTEPDSNIGDAGFHGVDFGDAVSPTGSRLVKNPGGSGRLVNSLLRDFPTSAGTWAHAAYDLRLEQLDPSENVLLSGLIFGPGPSDSEHYYVELIASQDRATLQEEVAPADGGPRQFPQTALARGLPVGNWIHVEMIVDFAAQANTILVNGATALDRAPMAPSHRTGLAGLEVGLSYFMVGTAGPATARFDNVVVELR
jgi:hypothetical protein